jgi:hypothetical protein
MRNIGIALLRTVLCRMIAAHQNKRVHMNLHTECLC